jgi:molybdopterin-guanine dinucleotide biosynthesis protein A
VTPGLLRSLAAACQGVDVAVPQTGPLPGAYRRRALPVLQRRLAAERLSLRDALAELETRTVELDEQLLANVNTPDDLSRLG